MRRGKKREKDKRLLCIIFATRKCASVKKRERRVWNSETFVILVYSPGGKNGPSAKEKRPREFRRYKKKKKKRKGAGRLHRAPQEQDSFAGIPAAFVGL